MTIPEIITVLKDVLIGVAAATTAIVAVLGLRKWRQELEGKAHFEAARNLIRSTYRLRDEVRACRNPFYGGHEFPDEYEGTLRGDASNEQQLRAWAHVYKNRWAPVLTALQEFDAHTLEAEALWGASVRTRTDSLRACLSELNSAIDAVLRDKAGGGEDFKADREYGKEIRGVVAAPPHDKENKLNRKINEALGGVEQELRPHLRRR